MRYLFFYTYKWMRGGEMSRKPDERIEKAKNLYGHGVKLVEIASQLNVPASTVRRWKCTHSWDNERSEKESERSDKKSERSDKITSARKKITERKKKEEEVIVEEVRDVMENPELTDKQRLFCCLYIKSFNATKAYQKAYQCDEYTAMTNGSRMLRNAKVRDEIQRLKQRRLNREMLSEEDVFQKYLDIAYADYTDYMEFGRETVPVMGPFGPIKVDGEELTKEINVVKYKDSNMVDGTLIQEVRQGRDGASVKLMDRMKALDWLAAHMDMGTAEQKAKLRKLEAEVEQLRKSGADQDEDEGVMIVNDLPKDGEDF